MKSKFLKRIKQGVAFADRQPDSETGRDMMRQIIDELVLEVKRLYRVVVPSLRR